MNFQIPFAYGIIACYILCLFIVTWLTRDAFKHRNYQYFGYGALVCFVITLIQRNYKVFVLTPIRFSEDVMISNYFGAAFCLIGFVFLWKFRNK